MKIKISLLFISLFLSLINFGQSLPTIILPTINPVNYTTYVDFANGNDLNDGLSKTTPVKTFDKALRNCPWGTTTNKITNSEIVVLAGNYILEKTLTQAKTGPTGYLQIIGSDTLYRNISLRGDGIVTLNAVNVNIISGSGIVSLIGNNIFINNLTLKNSGSNGISLRKGAHDISIEYVTIDGAIQFGLQADSISKGLVQYCTFTNCNLNNKDQFYLKQIPYKKSWGSALKCRWSTNITVRKNKVFHNWGEGINFNRSSNCTSIGNEVYDNYGTNVYCDNASNTIIRNNLIYNTTDSTYWIFVFLSKQLTSDRKSATIINIGNEDYSTTFGAYKNTKNIYFFNNIAFNGEIQIGNGGFVGSSFENVYIFNNTSIGLVSGKTTFTSLFYPKSISANTIYKNINITNNIFSLDPLIQQSSDFWKLCSLSQTALSTEMKFGNNYWSCNPTKDRYNCIYNPTTDSINSSLPYNVTRTTLNILQASNNSLTLSRPVTTVKGITFDYAYATRGTIRSNVGAYENIIPVLKDGLIDKISIENQEKEFVIFPNPSSTGDFKIALNEKLADKPISVEIFSTIGELVLKQEFNSTNLISFKVNAIGVFILKLSDGTNTFTKKIIVK